MTITCAAVSKIKVMMKKNRAKAADDDGDDDQLHKYQ